MRFRTYIDLWRALINDSSTKKFLVGVILGLAFSMATILATIGIMDGFVSTMKDGLSRTEGDLVIYSYSGFFEYSSQMKNSVSISDVKSAFPQLQTEGFIMGAKEGGGVIIRGVTDEHFKTVFPNESSISSGGAVIGRVLATKLGLKEGDDLTIALASGNAASKGLPALYQWKLSSIVSHNIHKKDLRLVYLPLAQLQKTLKAERKVNSLSIRLNNNSNEKVEEVASHLTASLGNEFRARPYWQEFATLISAVEIEKFMIGLILQLIVIISIINVLGFVIYMNEQKVQELFLLQAFGLNKDVLQRVWFSLTVMIWLASCATSGGFLYFFKFLLEDLGALAIPGEIYHLSALTIQLGLWDAILVFMGAFFWLTLMSYLGIRRLRKQPILSGLRQEFA